MTKKTTETPLGGKTSLYLTKLHKNGAIHIKPQVETLEFYPAGYTKSGMRGQSRQSVLKALWEAAVSMGTENLLFPFERIPHNVALIPANNNLKDKHALYVVVESPMPGSLMGHVDGRDIGWCPMRISQQVRVNLKMINGGRILRIRQNYHGKYYTAKVIFGYGDNRSFIDGDMSGSTRFADMADEII